VAHNPWNSDQDLLRDHYRDTVLLLPYKYNVNQASCSAYWRSNWDRAWLDRRTTHFTLTKPLLALPTGAQYSEWATQSAARGAFGRSTAARPRKSWRTRRAVPRRLAG
jgi:hypothetical protein